MQLFGKAVNIRDGSLLIMNGGANDLATLESLSIALEINLQEKLISFASINGLFKFTEIVPSLLFPADITILLMLLQISVKIKKILM